MVVISSQPLVVVLTSSGHQTDLARAFELGADAYLVKPNDFNQLVVMVQDLRIRFLDAAGGGGWDAKGRKRKAAFFARGPVSHPGMSARPELPAAFAAAERPASDAIAAAIFKITSETP